MVRVESVILLDMRMPVMTAGSSPRRTAPAHAPLPIVVLTATHHARAWDEEVRDNAVIAQPFDLGDLTAVLGRFTRCVTAS